MTEVIMVRVDAGFVPADVIEREALSHIKVGDRVMVKISKPRSLDHHRKFFAVLQFVAQSTEWETPERLLVAIKIALGRYDLCKLPNGKVVPVPQSISFVAMPQAEFSRFFDEAIHMICRDVLPGTSPDELLERTGVTRIGVDEHATGDAQ